jgi:hypothetical protein
LALVALFVDIGRQQPLLVGDGLARVGVVDNERVPAAVYAGFGAKPPATRSFSTTWLAFSATWLARPIGRDGTPGFRRHGEGANRVFAFSSFILTRVRR